MEDATSHYSPAVAPSGNQVHQEVERGESLREEITQIYKYICRIQSTVSYTMLK
jgi:hypothetical protein